MSVVYLLRHGEADFTLPARWGAPGWGADLAPLTPRGVEQIRAVAEALQRLRPQLIISSPMTRALQSALLLSGLLQLSCTVEFDLHEWVPDRSFAWTSLEDALAAIADLDVAQGEWPPGETRAWEPLSSVRARALGVLTRYRNGAPVAAVCHGMLIRSLTGRRTVGFAEIVPFELA
jgi:broad specificity phosphatase PhoE